MSVEEEWIKWWATVPYEYTDMCNEDVARSAYLAGRADERKRCVTAIEKLADDIDINTDYDNGVHSGLHFAVQAIGGAE